jgi:alkyl hydroperoxide reductase subunit AhpC
VRNRERPEEAFASHATFIVDRDGIIRQKLYQLSYAEQPAVDALVRALRSAQNLNGARTP